MFAPQNPKKTINIAFYLVPEFSMIGFSALVDPLRQANSQSGKRLYQWQVVSATGGPVAASNGMSLIADCALGRDSNTDRAITALHLDTSLDEVALQAVTDLEGVEWCKFVNFNE